MLRFFYCENFSNCCCTLGKKIIDYETILPFHYLSYTYNWRL